MGMKMNGGLFEIDNSQEEKEITVKKLQELLSLMKQYQNIPILSEEFKSSIPKLDTLIKNIKK